jgi:hypothetical protein
VPLVCDALHDGLCFRRDVFVDQEKGGESARLGQGIEQRWCPIRIGPIVKGEIQSWWHVRLPRDVPQRPRRTKCLQEEWEGSSMSKRDCRDNHHNGDRH